MCVKDCGCGQQGYDGPLYAVVVWVCECDVIAMGGGGVVVW